jgi:AAA family ATP:ADP antiporter
VFAYYIGHPEIGLSNTHTDKYRLFGWLFYFFIEGFSPFVVSVFWAFANSVNSPEGAKKNYGWMVSGSKLGGMIAAGFAWFVVGLRNGAGEQLYSDVFNHQLLLVGSSLMLLLVPVIILLMMKKIPGRYLHGYEAVYQVEKQKKREGQDHTGVFVGLKMLIKYPYVLGIFGMAFFYEVCGTVLSYLSIGIAQEHSTNSTEALRYLLVIIFYTHTAGFLISLLGTSWLFRMLGTRRCLLLVPITAGLACMYYVFNADSPQALMITFVILRAINYAFGWPLRESLYIPTVKEIKFKSKAWIDAFGSKFAKTTGSTFNIVVKMIGSGSLFFAHTCFFGGIVFLWFVTAWLLGRRFEQAVAHNEVIGFEEDEK